MEFWGYFWFFAIIIGLGAGLYLLSRLDNRTKGKTREEAYRLLDQENPSPSEVKKVLKSLHLYGGRLRRDPEFTELRERLYLKLNAREK